MYIVLNGSSGRMNKTISQLALLSGHEVFCIPKEENPELYIQKCDVVIDFSFHDATVPFIKLAAKYNKPAVIGTTGHTAEESQAIKHLATQIPIIQNGCYAVSVILLNYLTKKAAKILSNDYHPEIIELHHTRKKDAPGGSAQELKRIICQERQFPENSAIFGRNGPQAPRPDDQIGVHTLRAGDIIGEHIVNFLGTGESIHLAQRSSNRQVFAKGALKAMQWILDKPSGFYTLKDVLDIND